MTLRPKIRRHAVEQIGCRSDRPSSLPNNLSTGWWRHLKVRWPRSSNQHPSAIDCCLPIGWKGKAKAACWRPRPSPSSVTGTGHQSACQEGRLRLAASAIRRVGRRLTSAQRKFRFVHCRRCRYCLLHRSCGSAAPSDNASFFVLKRWLDFERAILSHVCHRHGGREVMTRERRRARRLPQRVRRRRTGEGEEHANQTLY